MPGYRDNYWMETSLNQAIGALRSAVEMGYGLVIATGDVGAEDKGHIVEEVLALDLGAATPFVVHYSTSR